MKLMVLKPMEEDISEMEKRDLASILIEIRTTEDKLATLRKTFLTRTGELPPRRQQDLDWRWTVFLSLGIAYITFFVYFLGVRKTGKGEGFAIPEFLYSIDVQYYVILTFFILFLVLNIQQDRIRGYQVFVIFLGFWCAHWLIYDWSWWATKIGFGQVDLTTFWTSEFGSPLLIDNPPMWLFLLEALLGAIVSLYTFLVPHNYKTLVPPFLWLYTVYANASVCGMIGLNTPITLLIGVCFIIVVFGLMGFNTYSKFHIRNNKLGVTSESEVKHWFSIKKWSLDPLGVPMLPINIILIVLSYLFLVLIPEIGLLMGILAWYCFPGITFLLNGTHYAKLTRGKKILTIVFMLLVVMGLAIFLSAAIRR